MKIMSVVALDARGYTTINMYRTDTGAGAILAAVAALSNASCLETWEGPQLTGVPSPTAALYESGLQVCRFTYLCADGSFAVIAVPAPSAAIMQTDLVSVDPANALVVALNTAAIGNLEAVSGSLATTFLSGSVGPRPQKGG